MGIYEKGLEILSNLKKMLFCNIKFVFFVGLGILVAMVFGSKLIIYFLNKHYLVTMFCFIGMIIGGIKPIFNNIYKELDLKKIIYLLFAFFSIILLSIVKFTGNNTNNIFTYFISGISEAISTIVPGISGTALLMVIGTYNEIMNVFSNLFNFSLILKNLAVIIPFLFGLIIGVIFISKLINYLFKKYRINTYYAIMGFSLASVFLMFIQTLNRRYSISEILLAFITFILGYVITIKLPE